MVPTKTTGSIDYGFSFSLYHLAWQVADLMYPPLCGGCGQPGVRWCSSCSNQVGIIQKPSCSRCGAPVQPGIECEECREHPPQYDQLRSWAVFNGPLREALHSLKYSRNLGMGEIFAAPLLEILKEEKWEFDAVIPIPLSKAHQRQRGYNQAQVIARPIALITKKELLTDAVKRTKETTSQVELSPVQRYANLKDAFSANPAKLNGRSVLLVDDVATTGATLNSCASALRDVNVKNIYCITVAKAIRRNQGPSVIGKT